MVRRSIVQKVGGFRQEFDGAQDHDFIFRCIETAEDKIMILGSLLAQTYGNWELCIANGSPEDGARRESII